MLVTLIALAGATVFTLLMMVILSDMTPVMPGQRWYLKGIGPVAITKVLGYNAHFKEDRLKGLTVQYTTAQGRVGYCTKGDIRTMGKLQPYNQSLAEKDMKEKLRPDVEELLDLINEKKKELPKEWQPYTKSINKSAMYNNTAPRDRDDTVVEAEIIYPKQFQKQRID